MSIDVPVTLGVGGPVVGNAEITISGGTVVAIVKLTHNARLGPPNVQPLSMSFRQGEVDHVD